MYFPVQNTQQSQALWAQASASYNDNKAYT